MEQIFYQDAYFEAAHALGISKREAKSIAMIANEIGLSPMLGITKIRVVNGQFTLGPLTMLALVRATNQLEEFTVKEIPNAYSVTMKRNGFQHIETFTMNDAEQLGLLERWRLPKQMLKLRAIANGCRVLFPDI